LQSQSDECYVFDRLLSNRAKAPHGLISLIEKNKCSPSVSSLRKITGGLPMTLGADFSRKMINRTTKSSSTATNEKSSVRHRMGAAGKQGRIGFWQIGDAKKTNLQLVFASYTPGADTGQTLWQHELLKGGMIFRGELEISVGNRVSVLNSCSLAGGRTVTRTLGRRYAKSSLPARRLTSDGIAIGMILWARSVDRSGKRITNLAITYLIGVAGLGGAILSGLLTVSLDRRHRCPSVVLDDPDTVPDWDGGCMRPGCHQHRRDVWWFRRASDDGMVGGLDWLVHAWPGRHGTHHGCCYRLGDVAPPAVKSG